jgi:hypothetical protein
MKCRIYLQNLCWDLGDRDADEKTAKWMPKVLNFEGF